MAFSFLQTARSTGVGTDPAIAFSSNCANGSLVVVALMTTVNGLDITTSVTDSLGAHYEKAVFQAVSGNGLTVWYGITPGAGTNTVTAHFNTSTNGFYFIHEYSGPDPYISFDVVSSATGTSTTPDSGNATTKRNADLVFGVVYIASASVAPTAGTALAYTIRQDSAGDSGAIRMATEDATQTAAGSIHADWTLPSSQTWGSLMVAFKVPGGPVFRGS